MNTRVNVVVKRQIDRNEQFAFSPQCFKSDIVVRREKHRRPWVYDLIVCRRYRHPQTKVGHLIVD